LGCYFRQSLTNIPSSLTNIIFSENSGYLDVMMTIPKNTTHPRYVICNTDNLPKKHVQFYKEQNIIVSDARLYSNMD